MRQYTSLFLLALICISQVSAVTLRRSINNLAMDSLHNLAKKSPYASRIVSAVELHLTSGGQVDDVIELVRSALNDVQAKRDSLQKEFDLFRNDYNQKIADDVSKLNELNGQLSEVKGQIDQLNSEIGTLEGTIDRLNGEIEDLNQREILIQKARDNDIVAWNKRNIRDQNALEALDVIISELERLLNNERSFLQQSFEQINRAMKRIPSNNPIKALVQLSTKFDEDKLRVVIQKLRQIEQAVRSGNDEDHDREKQSKEHFDLLMLEIDTIRGEKVRQLSDAQRDLRDRKDRLAVKETERDNLQELIQETDAHKAKCEETLNNETPVYELRLKEADEAITGIREALSILEAHRASLVRSENLSNDLRNGNWGF